MSKVLRNILIFFQILINKIIIKRPDFSEKKIFLQGQILSEKKRKLNIIRNFKDVEFSCFSQFGEDGIISWITSKIPELKRVFIEIGTEDYWESNTRFLLKSSEWKGYLFEGSREQIKNIKKQRTYWQNNITAICSFVSRENINDVISENVKEKNIGLLSMDIDGNDLWILDELNCLSSEIVICEYNTILGDVHELAVPYEKNFNRTVAHFSNLYFGCSIKALISMMKKKNYFFLGTSSTGINAFFVKEKYKQIFDKAILEKKYFPAIIREGRGKDKKLTFDNIYKNLEKIKHLSVIDLKTNKKKLISEIGSLYSDDWKRIIDES